MPYEEVIVCDAMVRGADGCVAPDASGDRCTAESAVRANRADIRSRARLRHRRQTPQSSPAPATPPPAASSNDQVVPQQDNPNVKPGSKADVNAIGNRNVGKGLDFYSLEREIALGKALAQEVEKSAKFITDPVITEYVNRVGQNLVRNSDAQVPFTIKVIDSDVVNAFALPGGFFYVNSGLILHADEESELAGVMAHEIAHVCARHGTKQATKGDIVQIASIPAMIFIPYTWAGYALYQGMNFMIPVTFLKFSRDAEREADYLGLQYMYKAGLRSQRLRGVLRKGAGGRKETARHDSQGFLHASAHSGPHRSDAKGNRHHPAGARRVHRHHFGIRHREAPAGSDRVEPEGEERESEQAHAAQAHRPEQGRLRPSSTAGSRSQQHRHFGPRDTSSDDGDRPTLKRRSDDGSTVISNPESLEQPSKRTPWFNQRTKYRWKIQECAWTSATPRRLRPSA